MEKQKIIWDFVGVWAIYHTFNANADCSDYGVLWGLCRNFKEAKGRVIEKLDCFDENNDPLDIITITIIQIV